MAKVQEEQAQGVWNVTEFKTTEKTWSERNFKEKLIFLGILLIKFALMLLLLYLFIISLDLMSNSFRILGGKTAGRTFRNSDLFDNPLAGLAIGVLVTVLVQSSSTSTSIIITMTAGNLIEVNNAIPMIMGANIGTSVTNTIVSLGSIRNVDEYRRSFAGATVHDCFNYLTVLVLLPVEAATGLLRHMAAGICDCFDITDSEKEGGKTDFLKKLTKPIASRLLGIDKKLITTIAKEDDEEKLKKYEEQSIIKHKQKDSNHLFLDTPMSDGVAGVLMVFVSLMFLSICLMMLVKLLQTIFRGRIAIWFRSALNLEFQTVPFLANYVLIVFGMIITILFQSSSVTTSTLTPLVGIGLVRIDKMLAFTIGANVGTTVTGILSALVSDKRKTGLTVAFAHTLFNLIGFLIWYPFPPMRRLPIAAAKVLGNVAADLRWFPLSYILVMFGLMPLLLLGLALASPWLSVFIGIPFILGVLATLIIVGLRQNSPERLPGFLKRNPAFLPRSLRANVVSEDDPSAGAAAGIEPARFGRAEADADLGKNQWDAAPAVWGVSLFIFLALLAVIFNCQWGMVKYTDWDKRDHFGIGAWTTCSNAFMTEKKWAPVLNSNECTNAYLDECGASSLSGCQRGEYSSMDGVYKAYQKSWSECRSTCSAVRWEAWCLDKNCNGGLHVKQCSNVTKAVRGTYDVTYQPSGGVAWSEGEKCRDVDFLCPGMGGSVEVPGDLALVGWLCCGVGFFSVLAFQSFHGKRDLTVTLYVALGSFAGAWIFLLASFAHFRNVLDKDAKCIVDAESKTGAVWAHGRFGDIFNAGGYAYGFVLGSWLLVHVPMLLIVLRLKADPKPSSADEKVNRQAAGEVVAV